MDMGVCPCVRTEGGGAEATLLFSKLLSAWLGWKQIHQNASLRLPFTYS